MIIRVPEVNGDSVTLLGVHVCSCKEAGFFAYRVQKCPVVLRLCPLMSRLEPFCRLAASEPGSAQQTWIVMRMCADSWVGQDGLLHDWLNWGVRCAICPFLHHAAKHLGQPHDSCYLPLPSAIFFPPFFPLSLLLLNRTIWIYIIKWCNPLYPCWNRG